MSLEAWSWVFLVVYTALMLAFGAIGQRRVRSADDFATARGSYGPLPLGLAFAATTARGAPVLGSRTSWARPRSGQLFSTPAASTWAC